MISRHISLEVCVRIFFCLLFTVMISAFTFSQSAWTRASKGLPPAHVWSLCQQGSVLYAGTEKAGVYKSTDQGLNWTATATVPTFLNTQVWSMAVIDTSVFAGCRGGAVYRSTDGGGSWISVKTGMVGSIIQKLLPVGKTLYAGMYISGVWQSTDLGDHWTKVVNGNGMNDLNVYSLAYDGTYLYAGTSGSNTSPDTGVAFRYQVNGGTQWEKINNGFILNGVHLESVFGMGGDSLGIFAGTDDVGIFRTTDHGATWVQVDKDQGDVFGISRFGKYVYQGIKFGGVRISTDNGTTWKQNNQGLSDVFGSLVQIVTDFIYDGIFVYAATDSGVFRQGLNANVTYEHRIAETMPQKFSLEQNYPNPFNPTTAIGYQLSAGGMTTLIVYDALGREVVTLVNEMKEAGWYSATFNASQFASGIYFARLQSGDKLQLKKMLLLR
jgi:photosystem II stability/assembly factor-like uncharacterized protein